MYGAATNTNKFRIATGVPVLDSGEHVTGGLVAAGSLAAARGLLPTAGSVNRAAGFINSLRIFFLTLHQVSAKCTHAHDAVALNGF